MNNSSNNIYFMKTKAWFCLAFLSVVQLSGGSNWHLSWICKWKAQWGGQGSLCQVNINPTCQALIWNIQKRSTDGNSVRSFMQKKPQPHTKILPWHVSFWVERRPFGHWNHLNKTFSGLLSKCKVPFDHQIFSQYSDHYIFVSVEFHWCGFCAIV